MTKYAAVFLTLALLLANLGQALAQRRYGQAILIKAGQVVDVQNQKLLKNQEILVIGDKIAEIAPAGAIRTRGPAIAQTLDLSNATVLPGLIDMHVHITVDPEGSGGFISVAREALVGVRNARRTLEAGFTTIRNLGAYGYPDIALRDAINSGDVSGPRLVVSGPYIGMTGGHCDNNIFPPEIKIREETIVDGPWAVRSKVREVVKYGADVIKICATGGVFSKGDQPGTQEYTLEEIRAAAEEAHKLGRKIAAHAHGAGGIKEAIRGGIDSIEHASLIDDEGIQLAKKAGTYLVMDVYNDTYILEQGAKGNIPEEFLEKERQIGQKQRDNFKKAFQAGVKMAFGSDAGIYPHGDNSLQFAYMVQYGMSPMEAIQAATLHAAELLGWSQSVGRLAPGYFADLIAIQGNPLNDVHLLENVGFVMKGGEVIKNRL